MTTCERSTTRTSGNYAYERYTTADDKVRYHLTVYLRGTAPFEVL